MEEEGERAEMKYAKPNDLSDIRMLADIINGLTGMYCMYEVFAGKVGDIGYVLLKLSVYLERLWFHVGGGVI